MVSMLDVILGNKNVSDNVALAANNAALRQDLNEASHKIEELQESLLEIADAFDNVGWSPLGGKNELLNEMPLSTVLKAAEIGRAMTAVNPFVKHGVNARISYIWGDGVEFEKASGAVEQIIKNNKNVLFSHQAYEERERAAATDGNVFIATNSDGSVVFRVPFYQIVGVITNPENPEEIWYFRRKWKVSKVNSQNGQEESVEKEVYYPSLRYMQKLQRENRSVPKRWNKVGVDQTMVIQHTAVNKQVGWRWGVPDVMPVIFWAKAYKEYLEDNAVLVKAYSRIAWQIKTASQGGANSIAASLAATPSRDPLTGEFNDVGASAVTGTGTELVPTALNASAVSFEAGKPLAAAIASGLEVPLDLILSESNNSGASSTLDLPTLKAMEARRKIWASAFQELFEFWGDEDVKITWGTIEHDETHRRVQSVVLAFEQGQLHQEESRAEILKTLNIIPTSEDMPESPFERAERTAEMEATRAEAQAEAAASAVPAQGRSGGVGSLNSGRGQVRQANEKAMVNR